MAIGLQVKRVILTPHCRDLKSPTSNLLHTGRNKLFAIGNQLDFLGRKRLSSFPLNPGAMNGDVMQSGESEEHRRSPHIYCDQLRAIADCSFLADFASWRWKSVTDRCEARVVPTLTRELPSLSKFGFPAYSRVCASFIAGRIFRFGIRFLRIAGGLR